MSFRRLRFASNWIRNHMAKEARVYDTGTFAWTQGQPDKVTIRVKQLAGYDVTLASSNGSILQVTVLSVNEAWVVQPVGIGTCTLTLDVGPGKYVQTLSVQVFA